MTLSGRIKLNHSPPSTFLVILSRIKASKKANDELEVRQYAKKGLSSTSSTLNGRPRLHLLLFSIKLNVVRKKIGGPDESH